MTQQWQWQEVALTASSATVPWRRDGGSLQLPRVLGLASITFKKSLKFLAIKKLDGELAEWLKW
jgi:hypothetical protein